MMSPVKDSCTNSYYKLQINQELIIERKSSAKWRYM